MTGTWPTGWATGDIETATEFKKGVGSIFDSTLVGSAANIDITSIIGTYAHLMVVIYARGDTAAGSVLVTARFNADAAANYDYQYVLGQTTVTSVEAFAQTAASVGIIPAATASANYFGVSVGYIPNYAGSTNNKVVVSAGSESHSAAGNGLSANVTAGFWRSAAAITRITLLPSAGNFVAGTRVTVYGMGS